MELVLVDKFDKTNNKYIKNNLLGQIQIRINKY